MNKLVRIEQQGGCLCWVTNTPTRSNYVQTFWVDDISGLTFYKKEGEEQCIVTIAMKKGEDFSPLQIDEKDYNVLHEAVFGFDIPAIDVLIPKTKVDVQKDTVQENSVKENATETKTDVPEIVKPLK